MPNENDRNTTQEDALSAAESLFGDTTVDKPIAVAKEEDASKEALPEPQDSEMTGGKESEGAGTSPSEDLKVVVSIRGGLASIGLQRPSSDPYIELFDDSDVAQLVQKVPSVLDRAKIRWEDSPKNPTYERPAASTGRRNRRNNQTSAQESNTEEGESQQQTLQLF